MFKYLILFIASSVGAAFGSSDAKHELYICGNINLNYVTGSKYLTLNGIYHREPNESYIHIGQNFTGIYDLAFDPFDHNHVFAASMNGVMSSKDNGKNWRVETDWRVTEAKAISMDPQAPKNIYVALPDGILSTNDFGKTWVRNEEGLPVRGKYTQAIKCDRYNTGVVLAGCESGIYIFTKSTKKWTRVFSSKATILDIQQSPLDENLWIAATELDGVQISHDGGFNWRKINNLASDHAWYNIAYDSSNKNRFVIVSWTYGVFITEDSGLTWTNCNAGLPKEHQAYKVAVDPDTNRIYLSILKDCIYISDDFGKSWTKNGLSGSNIYNFIFISDVNDSLPHS